jgi:hypothetical protein
VTCRPILPCRSQTRVRQPAMNSRASWTNPPEPTSHVSTTETLPADPPLSAVLQGKPPNDDVPLAAWWLIAESLRHSVPVRRAAEGVETLATAELCLEKFQARLASQFALHELGDHSIFRKASSEEAAVTGQSSPVLTLRGTIRNLARLMVRGRPTPTSELVTAIQLHLEALKLVTVAPRRTSLRP